MTELPEKYAGIDYSISCPCICIYTGLAKDFNLQGCQFHYLITQKKYQGIFGKRYTGYTPEPAASIEERFDNIAMWAGRIVLFVEHIALEGYAFGAKGMVFQIGECTGQLKNKLWQDVHTWETVAPTELKKWATGKGTASKELMHTQFLKETGFDLQKLLTPNKKMGTSPVSDIVDSYFLCKWIAQKNRTPGVAS